MRNSPRSLTRLAPCGACLASGLALLLVLNAPLPATALQQTCGDFPTQAAAQQASVLMRVSLSTVVSLRTP
jgi:hypothetical protein